MSKLMVGAEISLYGVVNDPDIWVEIPGALCNAIQFFFKFFVSQYIKFCVFMYCNTIYWTF